LSAETRSTTVVLRSLILPLYLPAFLILMGQGIYILTVPYFAASFGVSLILINVAITMTSLGNLAGNLPAGILLSRVVPWKVMILGSLVLALSSFATGMWVSFPVLVALRFIGGLGLALAFLSRYTFVAETVPAIHRGRASAMFGGTMRMGLFAGPLLGGLIGDRFGLPMTFHVAGALALLAVLTMVVVKEPPRARRVGDAPRSGFPGVRVLRLFRSRTVLAAAGAQILGQLIRAARLAIVPVYGAIVLELDVATTGVIIGVSGAFDMAMFPVSGYVMDRFGRRYNSIPSFSLMTIGMVVLATATSAQMLWVAAMVLGLGNGLGSGLMMTMGADLAPEGSKGEFLGLWRFIGNFGNSSGPLAVGVVADAGGLGLAAMAAAGFGVAAVLTLIFVVPETLIRESPKDEAKVSAGG
jgi:MFS family permease